MVQCFNMWMVLAVTGAVLATLVQCDSSVDTPLDNNVFPGSNGASVAIGGGLKLQTFGKPIVRLDNEGGGLVAVGYPKESPNIPFTYPSTSTTIIPAYSPSVNGYPKVSPSNPFTYPTRVTSVPTQTTAVNIGYPKVTPINPFTYPTTRITTRPMQLTSRQTFITNPSTTDHTILLTGYPKVSPSNPFTYPTTRYTSTTPRPTQPTTIRPVVTTTTPTRPSTIQYVTTPRPTQPTTIVTGYPKVSPSHPFTYPTTRFTFTTPRPTQPTTKRPIVTTYAPTQSSTIQFITTPRPTIVTGYPKVTPSNPFTYPTTRFTFTTARPAQPTTIRPIVTTSAPTQSSTIQYVTTPKPTQPTTIVTGYPKVSPSNPFTYPTTRFTFTTPRPTQPTTKRPIVTTYAPTQSSTIQFITTPRPTIVTGYPKVTPSNPFTYPTTRFTFTTARPTQPTTIRPIVTTSAPTQSSTIQYVTTPKPTQPTTIVTGYPKVSPSNPFTYPTTRFTFTTPRPTLPTTRRSIVTTYAPTQSSTIQFITTSRPTIVTGYPKVTPSNPFTYPTTRFTFTTPRPTLPTTRRPIVTTYAPTQSSTIQFITTPRPTIVTGYPKVTPSNPFTYPTTRFTFTTPRPTLPTTRRPIVTTYAPTQSSTIQYLTTPRPTQPTTIVTGYPKVSPSNPFTYPTTRFTFTTPRPTQPTTRRPIVTTYAPTQSSTIQFITTPRPTIVTGYPKVTPSNPFTYPTTRFTFTTPRPTQPTTIRPIVTTSAGTRPSTLQYVTTPKPTQPTTIVTGYPKVTPSNPFTYPTTRLTFTTPRFTQPTTIRPIVTTSAPTQTSTIQFITTPSPTIVTGYPKVSPSNPFTYPTTIVRYTTRKPAESTTIQSFISTRNPTQSPTSFAGYVKFSPSNPLTYPTPLVTGRPIISTDLTTKSIVFSSSRPAQTIPAVTGYPRIVPVNPLTYPSRLFKRNAVIGSISGDGSGGVMRQERLSEPEISSSRVVRQDDGQYRPLEHGEAAHDDPNHWDIRKSVPGEPGKDYPVLTQIPETSFTCYGREEGYHADLETGCQVFHVCSKNADGVKNSFLCPNGSIFNQQLSICDWWKNVDCNDQFNSDNVQTVAVGTKRPQVTYNTTPRLKQTTVVTTPRPTYNRINLLEGDNAVGSAERNSPATPAPLPPFSLVPPFSGSVANQPNTEEDINGSEILSDSRYSTSSRPVSSPEFSKTQPGFINEFSSGNAHSSNGISELPDANVELPNTTVRPSIQYTPSEAVNSINFGSTTNKPASVTTSSSASPEYSPPVTTKLFIQNNDNRGYSYEPVINDFGQITQTSPQITNFETGSGNIDSPVQTPHNNEYSVKLTDLLNPEQHNGKFYPDPSIETIHQNQVTVSTTPKPFPSHPSEPSILDSSREVSIGTTTVAPGIASSLLPPIHNFIQPEFIPRGFSHQPPIVDFDNYRGSISTTTLSPDLITKSPFEYLPPQPVTEEAISSLLLNKPAPGDVSSALLGQVDIREKNGIAHGGQQSPAIYNTYKEETSSQLHNAVDQNAVKIYLSSESPIHTLSENSPVSPVEANYQINLGAQNIADPNSYASSFAEYNPSPQVFSNINNNRNSPIPTQNLNGISYSTTPTSVPFDLSQNNEGTVLSTSTSKPFDENLNIATGFLNTLVSSTPRPFIASSSEGNSHLVTSTPVPLSVSYSDNTEGAIITPLGQGGIGTILSNPPSDRIAYNNVNSLPYKQESNGQINVRILPSVDASAEYKYSPYNGNHAAPLQIKLPTETHSYSQGVLTNSNVYQDFGLHQQPQSDVSQRSNVAIPIEQPEIFRSVSFDFDTPEGRKEFESAVASGLFRDGRSTLKEQLKEDVKNKTESA